MLDKEELEILIFLENVTFNLVFKGGKYLKYTRLEQTALKYFIPLSKLVLCKSWSKGLLFKSANSLEPSS